MKSLTAHRLFFLILMLLTLFALYFLAGCGDDDDDNDDNDTIDDDTAPDDDTVDDDDDDATPDDDDDDDTTPDDDDDDTGPVDYTREPLTVIDCPVTCADVDETVDFAGGDSTDPNGLALSYAYDFGDGDTANGVDTTHAFDQPGAYRVTLTVENDEGYTDQSSCIVTVGELPTTGSRTLDSIEFQSNYVDRSIIEEHMPPSAGGRFFGFFIAPQDATPDTIIINGEVYQNEVPPANLSWCDVVPAVLLEGEVGIVRCHANHRDYNAGKNVTIEIKDGATTLWQKTQRLLEPELRLSYITTTTDGAELLVYARNDTEREIEVTGLAIDGLDVSDFAVAENAILAPGETAAVRVPYCDGFVDYHEWKAFTVFGTDGRAEIQETRALKLFEPRFFVGDWNGSSHDVFLDPETALVPLLENGVNTFKWDIGGPVPPEDAFAVAEEYDFNIWTHHGGLSQTQIDIIEEWGDNPHWVLNATKGEGDLEHPPDHLVEVQLHRELWPHQRLWVYNNLSYYFHFWAGMADFGGMDHYCVWAPQSNWNFPPGYWDKIENLGVYAEIYRRNSEPGPTWFWSQAIWNSFDIEDWQVRCTTAAEIRSQWYEVIGHGARSMFWFYFRYGWIDDCNDPDAVDEHRKVAAEAYVLEDIILEGSATLPDQQWASTENENVELRTLTAPDAMLIVLVNLDYDLNLLLPFQWYEQNDIVVEVNPPDGFEPADFILVKDDTQTSLEWAKTGEHTWSFTLPSLPVAEAILVVPEP